MIADSRPRLATAALAVAQLTGEYSMLVMPFILAAMMDGFHLSETTAGRLVSLQLLGMAGGATLVTLTLRRGRSLRRQIGLGAAAIVVANVACALLDSPAWLALARGITGLGEGIVMAAAAAAVCATPNPHQVFSMISMTAAFVAIGALLAIPHIAAHWGPDGVFWLLALTPILLFSVLRWVPSAAAATAATAMTARTALWHGLPLLLAALAFWSGSSGLWVYAERIGAYQGLTREQMGFLLSVGQLGAFPGPLVSAWAVPRFGVRRALFVGCLGMAIATVSFIFGGRPWTYALGGFVASFCILFVVPCLRSRMAQLDPSGRTLALSAGAYTVGFGLSPLIVSSINTTGRGYAHIGAFCVVCFLVSAALGAVRGTTTPPRAFAP